MQIILFAYITFLFALKLARAEIRPKCSSRCDVSQCPSPSCPGGYVPDRCHCCLVCSRGEGESCGRKNDLPCGDGLECKVVVGKRRTTKGMCKCKMGFKVCGSDGKTYGNVCLMKAASRKAMQKGRSAVTLALRGLCPSSTGPAPVHPNSLRYRFNFIADVVEKIAPAVVHIELFLRHPLFGRHVPLSSGSGFITTNTGLIVTNAHVVTTTAPLTGRPQLRVQLHDGNAYEATIRDVDHKSDIATIKVNAQKKLPVLALGRSADLRPGERGETVTTGIVSTAQRDGKELGIRDSDMDYIQTDAIINYGNSGGPLVNLDGEVIGINTLKVTAGISFAIPSDRIQHFLSESQHMPHRDKARLLSGYYRIPEPQSDADGGTGRKRRVIGIKMLTITEALVAQLKQDNPGFPDVSSGVLVHQVIPDSPAQKCGIKAGDVIVNLNGHVLRNIKNLQEALLGDVPLLMAVRRGNGDLLFNIEPHVIRQ